MTALVTFEMFQIAPALIKNPSKVSEVKLGYENDNQESWRNLHMFDLRCICVHFQGALTVSLSNRALKFSPQINLIITIFQHHHTDSLDFLVRKKKIRGNKADSDGS